jgi:hypothetical protein
VIATVVGLPSEDSHSDGSDSGFRGADEGGAEGGGAAEGLSEDELVEEDELLEEDGDYVLDEVAGGEQGYYADEAVAAAAAAGAQEGGEGRVHPGGDGPPPLPRDSIAEMEARLEDLVMLRQIGKGAAAKIFLVRHIATDELYALKVLSKRSMAKKKKGVAHVMKELEILKTCSHPFVVALEASFQTRAWLCHLIEYCPAGNFYRLCQSQPDHRLSEEAAQFYTAEILSGIEYLHLHGFVYRDLKPENILVAASGHLRLTDFDLSQVGDEADVQVFRSGSMTSLLGKRKQVVGVSQKAADQLEEKKRHGSGKHSQGKGQKAKQGGSKGGYHAGHAHHKRPGSARIAPGGSSSPAAAAAGQREAGAAAAAAAAGGVLVGPSAGVSTRSWARSSTWRRR